MLNSGKNIRDLRDKKKKILTLVLSEKKFLNETKNHNYPHSTIVSRCSDRREFEYNDWIIWVYM